MQAAEILRKLADIVDASAQPAPQQQPVVINIAGGQAGAQTTAQEPDAQPEHPEGVMIPPLQQKLEIMKQIGRAHV